MGDMNSSRRGRPPINNQVIRVGGAIALPPLLRARGIRTVIPQRSDQIAHRQSKGRAGGRPPRFDPDLYRLRNVVERAFNRLKQWRGIASRYDKHARNYRAGILLAAVVMFWL